MPDESYGLDEVAFEQLALAGVSVEAVPHVLYIAHPLVRRHLGGSLQIVGRDHNGEVLAVALVEHDDDR